MNTEEKPRFAPFPNGTSFMLWNERNCDRCWKSKVNESTGKSRCAIEYAIAVGSVSDGTFLADGTRTIANAKRLSDRLGWDGKSYLENDCPERQEKQPARKKKQQQNQPELI
jgi:hypothetical protein